MEVFSLLILLLSLNIVSFVGKPGYPFQRGLVQLETHFLVTVIVTFYSSSNEVVWYTHLDSSQCSEASL